MRRIAFIFVVDGPGLELQSLLLAPSLRAFHPNDRIIAYRPKGAAPLAWETAHVFTAAAVEVTELDHDGTGLWARPYPHGNKILACAAARDADLTIFLDTDMVAARAVDEGALPQLGAVAVVPEGVPTWGKDGDRWARAYGHFGFALPEERVRLTRRKRREFLPYFNAGMVAFCAGDGFAECWLDTALEIDHRLKIGGKRPWLDQIALPIALRRAGLSYRVLAADYNFSISGRAHEPDADPVFVHYHRFRYLKEWPQGPDAWAALRRLLPAELLEGIAARFDRAGFPVTAF